MTKTDKTELKLLKDLQLISEEISDLANNGKFENIKSLDKKRRDIIKSFTKIPTETTRIEISKRTNQKPEEFDLEFTKDEVYAGKIKLLLDKTFHSSIEDAITKYKELQKILNESI